MGERELAMGMDSMAGHGWVAKEEWLQSLNLDGWDELQAYIEEHDEWEVAESIQHESAHEMSQEVYKALLEVWNRVERDFAAKTELELNVYYHDADTGSRYDEIRGLVYLVGRVTHITAPAQREIDAGNIQEAWWTTWG